MVRIAAINELVVFIRIFENYEKCNASKKRLILQDLRMALLETISNRQTQRLQTHITGSIRLFLGNGEDHT